MCTRYVRKKQYGTQDVRSVDLFVWYTFFFKYNLPYCSTILKGIGIGIGLSFWQPEDPVSKSTAILWIGLVGDLFIRALKCIVLPLVFVSIAISVMDMLSLGNAGKLVGSTIGLYLLTTLCAAIIGKWQNWFDFNASTIPSILTQCTIFLTFAGVICSLIYSPFYTLHEDGQEEEEGVPPNVRLACAYDESYEAVGDHSWFESNTIDVSPKGCYVHVSLAMKLSLISYAILLSHGWLRKMMGRLFVKQGMAQGLTPSFAWMMSMATTSGLLTPSHLSSSLLARYVYALCLLSCINVHSL